MRSIRPLSLMLVFALLVSPLWPGTAVAQARRRAAPPIRGGVVIGAYYRPLYLSPFYDPFWDPWWYPYPYGWYGAAAFGPGYDRTASVRLEVTPRQTEVYVDGYYAGIVDDFDGMFQRLHVRPGEHELTLYLAGYRTVTQRVFLQRSGTFRVRQTMTPLGPGDAQGPRPSAARPAADNAPAPPPAPRAPRRPPQPAPPNPPPSPQPPPDRDGVRGDASYGALAIRVQPADADVLIDGERWQGPAVDEVLIVQVGPGPHRIEVRKEGYRSYAAEVMVNAAQTSPINISLTRQ